MSISWVEGNTWGRYKLEILGNADDFAADWASNSFESFAAGPSRSHLSFVAAVGGFDSWIELNRNYYSDLNYGSHEWCYYLNFAGKFSPF